VRRETRDRCCIEVSCCITNGLQVSSVPGGDRLLTFMNWRDEAAHFGRQTFPDRSGLMRFVLTMLLSIGMFTAVCRVLAPPVRERAVILPRGRVHEALALALMR
jgi:hypothetical protein